jgi:hypothetical protein
VYQISVACCVAIALATLGMGEHYLLDLVVAVPFALGVEAACAGQWSWRVGLAGALTALWIGVVRVRAVPSELAAWASMAGTVALGSMLGAGAPRAAQATVPSDHRTLRERLLAGVGLR